MHVCTACLCSSVCVCVYVHVCACDWMCAWYIPYSRYNVWGSISAKHQFFYPAVISANPFNYQIRWSRCVLHWRAMASEVESFTIDSMIRGCHVYKDVWSSFIGEVLYCCCDVHNHHDPWVSCGQTSFSTGVIDPFAVAMCKGMTAVDACLRKYPFCDSLASATAFKTSVCFCNWLTPSVRRLTNGLSDQAVKQKCSLFSGICRDIG